MGKGERIFDIFVLIDDRRSRLGGTECGNCSDFDSGDSLLIFILAAFGGLDWRADVDYGGWLLGDTRAGDETINNSLNLGPTRLSKIHFDIPVHIIQVIVPVGCVGNTMYCFILQKIEVGIGPFLSGLGRCGNGNHVGK